MSERPRRAGHDRFPRVGRLHRGYHRRQVDAFLDRAEVSLNGLLRPLSAAEIRQAGFELVRHGYEVGAVDAALDEIEERAMRAQSATGGRRGRSDLQAEVRFLREELTTPYMKRFPRAGALTRGYDVDDVDDFLDRVADTLGGLDQLTVEDVRSMAFRPKRGGYAEDAVDDALDQVIELMLVLRRLTPQVLTRQDAGRRQSAAGTTDGA